MKKYGFSGHFRDNQWTSSQANAEEGTSECFTARHRINVEVAVTMGGGARSEDPAAAAAKIMLS